MSQQRRAGLRRKADTCSGCCRLCRCRLFRHRLRTCTKTSCVGADHTDRHRNERRQRSSVILPEGTAATEQLVTTSPVAALRPRFKPLESTGESTAQAGPRPGLSTRGLWTRTLRARAALWGRGGGIAGGPLGTIGHAHVCGFLKVAGGKASLHGHPCPAKPPLRGQTRAAPTNSCNLTENRAGALPSQQSLRLQAGFKPSEDSSSLASWRQHSSAWLRARQHFRRRPGVDTWQPVPVSVQRLPPGRHRRSPQQQQELPCWAAALWPAIRG